MVDKCTILSKVMNYTATIEVAEMFTNADVNIDGDINLWRSVQLNFDNSQLQLNSLVMKEPGDMFSKTILGIHNDVNSFAAIKPQYKDQVLDFISNTELIIGVVANPGYSEEDGHFSCIFNITGKLNALIFNGHDILDANGNILLSRYIGNNLH